MVTVRATIRTMVSYFYEVNLQDCVSFHQMIIHGCINNHTLFVFFYQARTTWTSRSRVTWTVRQVTITRLITIITASSCRLTGTSPPTCPMLLRSFSIGSSVRSLLSSFYLLLFFGEKVYSTFYMLMCTVVSPMIISMFGSTTEEYLQQYKAKREQLLMIRQHALNSHDSGTFTTTTSGSGAGDAEGGDEDVSSVALNRQVCCFLCAFCNYAVL